MATVSARRAARVSAILDLLAENQSLSASGLATRFGVSSATLRRDLQMLEDQKLLSRTHGGAMAHEAEYELPVRYRGPVEREKKRLIGARTVKLLPHGPLTLGLGGGTTAIEVARLLYDRYDLTVVTNALTIAHELAPQPRIKVILTGGIIRPQTYELVGALAEQSLQDLYIEVLVIGVDAISAANGLSTHNDLEAQTNRTLIQRSKRIIVVADGSKIGRTQLARISPVDVIDDLVTDSSANAQELDYLRQAGVCVHLVDAPSPVAGGG
jgi:DeoR family transcriptional regulator of aga operon